MIRVNYHYFVVMENGSFPFMVVGVVIHKYDGCPESCMG